MVRAIQTLNCTPTARIGVYLNGSFVIGHRAFSLLADVMRRCDALSYTTASTLFLFANSEGYFAFASFAGFHLYGLPVAPLQHVCLLYRFRLL